MLQCLEHEHHNFEILVARTEIWLPLSKVFPLTNPLGLLIMSWIVAMSSSERLARVCEESTPWSSTSFSTSAWLNPSLRNISFISLMMVDGGLSKAGAQAAGGTITASSSSPWSLASLKDFLSCSSLWLSPPGCSGTSCLACLPSSQHYKHARFALLVSFNLISITSNV